MHRFYKSGLFLLMLVALTLSACEVGGGQVKEEALVQYPTEIEVKVYNDKFFINNTQQVTKLDLAEGGAITFRTPGKAPSVNIVISQLGVDVPVAPGTTYRQVFPSVGSYLVSDHNSGQKPTLNVLVNKQQEVQVAEDDCSVISAKTPASSSPWMGLGLVGAALVFWRRRRA